MILDGRARPAAGTTTNCRIVTNRTTDLAEALRPLGSRATRSGNRSTLVAEAPAAAASIRTVVRRYQTTCLNAWHPASVGAGPGTCVLVPRTDRCRFVLRR